LKAHRLSIDCFAHFALRVDGIPVSLNNSKAEELIALLACERGQIISKARAAEQLWLDSSPFHARDSLYKVLHFIRDYRIDALCIPVVDLRECLYLDISHIDIDIEGFMRLTSSIDPDDCERAVSLYRRSLLVDSTYERAWEYEVLFSLRYASTLEALVAYCRNNHLQERARFFEHLLSRL
jgi:two-component SAPR family response regulator